MKKLLLCAMTFGLSLALVGCGSGTKLSAEEAKSQLGAAITKTNENSYTASSKMEMSVSVSGKSNGMTLSGSIDATTTGTNKIQGNNIYSKNVAEVEMSGIFAMLGASQKSTAEMYLMSNETGYDFYTSEFDEGETQAFTYSSITSTSSEYAELIASSNLQVDALIKNWDIFSKSGNVYTATNISLSDLNTSSLNMDTASSVLPDDMEIKIKKFAITLTDEGILSKIELNISTSQKVSENGASGKYTLSLSLTSTYSNYGSTTITVPAAVAALKPAA